MVSAYLLVHSPLLGPSSWEPVATVLRERGSSVHVPNLRGIAEAAPPRWRTYVGSATAAADRLDGDLVVVGHSGAGAYLPAIGRHLEERLAALVFVDAVLPPPSGAHEAPSRMRAMLDERTDDGWLRPWLSWWPDDVVADLLPDEDDRAALAADAPRLPRDLYDEPVPMPDGWSQELPCTYVRLSEGYDEARDDAAARGWPTASLQTDHLAIVTQPARVVDAIVVLA